MKLRRNKHCRIHRSLFCYGREQAKLCRQAGGSLEQIQFLLGYASIQTTERYLGGRQELRTAVNDNLGIGVP